MEEKNIEKIEKTYIIPQDSLYIYGIAILMMVWHHFFGFPERFGGDLRYIGGNIEYTIELYLGYFGRLCIAMYAFISGYGMMAKSMQKNLKFTEDIKLAIKQIIKFFIRYWIVFIIFVSIGFKFMGLKFEPEEFIKNFIGKSCSYNAEWWYVAYYVKMLIMYPVIKLIVNKLNFIKNSKWIIFALAIILGIINTVFKENYKYYLCFLFGMLIYENRLYEKFNAKLCKNEFYSIIISIGCIIFSVIVRMILTFDVDAFLVMIYIFGCLQILKTIKNNKWPGNILQFLGHYSVYIWLTHTFFLYYYFQNQFMQLKYAILIYIVTVCICLFIGVGLDKIYKGLMQGIKFGRKKSNSVRFKKIYRK